MNNQPTLRLFSGYWHTNAELRESVRTLQCLLNRAGCRVSEDGLFGWSTLSAVEQFQKARNLNTDGIVGPHTWAALRGSEPPEGETWFETDLVSDDRNMRLDLHAALNYKVWIDESASMAGIPASILLGIGSRESAWGRSLRPSGPSGTGDFEPRNSHIYSWRAGKMPDDGGGFGRGLMQIDYDWHEFARTGDWKHPEANIRYGAEELRKLRQSFLSRNRWSPVIMLRAAVASYNCGEGNVLRALDSGRDIDYFTAGRNYSADVFNRAGWFQRQDWR